MGFRRISKMATLQAVFLLILLMVLVEAGVCDHLEDQEVKLFLRTVIRFLMLKFYKKRNLKKKWTSPKSDKMHIRELTPTPEQLASLNLAEGQNTVTFTFSNSQHRFSSLKRWMLEFICGGGILAL